MPGERQVRDHGPFLQGRREPGWLWGRQGAHKEHLATAGQGQPPPGPAGSPELRLRQPHNSECTRI